MTDDSPTTRHPHGVSLGGTLIALLLLVTAPAAAAVGPAGFQSHGEVPAEPAFVVDLDADGSARITLTVTFDLATASERNAFEALRTNATLRERRAERFAGRLQSVAAAAENSSGRRMAVRDVALTFAEHDGTGVVALSVTWDGLAATDGDHIVVREPFTSGFDIDRPFRLVAPDGYTLTSVTPDPAVRTHTVAEWSGATTFDGFEATFTSTNGETTQQTSADAPGFGNGVTVVAILLVTAFFLARRRHR